jgi:hypothetical protein
MTTKDTLALALEALELSSITVDNFTVQAKCQDAITAIKQAQQAQEPVSDALIDQLFSVFQGWAGSTFGWQDSTSLDLAAANFERAKKAHEAECKRRLKEVFAAAPKQAEPVTGFGKIVGTHGKVVEWPVLPEQAEPEGYKLVPMEPTPVMCDAARWSEYGEETSRQYEVSDDFIKSVWDSLLAAAPTPPEAK